MMIKDNMSGYVDECIKDDSCFDGAFEKCCLNGKGDSSFDRTSEKCCLNGKVVSCFDEGLSLYIHIPFCISKCAYCAFYSEKFDIVTADRYVDGLKRTISFLSEKTEKEVVTIYFGGGTPTVLGCDRLVSILSHIKSCFKVAENCEITFEANPKTISYSDGVKLLKAGFNRVSLGFQTSDNGCLKTLGRIHTFEEATDCYRMLEKAGFDNISVDLMYALPDYSTKKTILDVENILKLNPKHISTYALSLEEGTPLFENRKKYVFPDDDNQLFTYLKICEILKSHGYGHYEVSNFCKDGFESRHNMGYWLRREYLGIGAGAHSFFNNSRFSVIEDRNRFIEAVEKGDFLTASGMNNAILLNENDIAEEEIMLSLRTSKGIALPSLSDKLKKLVSEGFANYEKSFFSLTDKGFFVSNNIIYQVWSEMYD